MLADQYLMAACQQQAALSWAPRSVVFDGSDTYMTKTTALAGATTKEVSLYVQVYIEAAVYGNNSMILNFGDGAVFNNAILRLQFGGGTENSLIDVQIRTGAYVVDAPNHITSETFTTADNPINILLSWNSNSGSEASTYYINDTAVSGYSDTPTTDEDFDWSQDLTYRIGCTQHFAGGQDLDGALGAVWMAPTYYDFSNVANRRLFHDASGNQVKPPAGAVLYFGGNQNAAAWNAGTNQGSGGDFTMTGAVTDA